MILGKQGVLTTSLLHGRHFTGDESFMDYVYTGAETAVEGKARWIEYVREHVREANGGESKIGEKSEHGIHQASEDRDTMIPTTVKLKARI